MGVARSVLSAPRAYGAGSLIERLSRDLTINGTTVSPTFRYEGKKAVGSTWFPTVGENLTLQAGTAPTLGQPSPTGARDRSVNFNAGGYFQASGNSFADITTEDFVIEAVLKSSGTNFPRLFSKMTASGYEAFFGATQITLVIDTGPVVVNTNVTLPAGQLWHHVMIFVDRSASSQGYVDGTAAGAAADVSGAAATLTGAVAFVIGANAGGTQGNDEHLAYLAMWKSAAWLDTHLQATLALSRAQFLGFA